MSNRKMSEAILQLLPNAQFILNDTDFENIQWLDERPKPTMAEIELAISNPIPKPEPTIADKLASVGLSVADLKIALGL